jgi:uncharacterized protein (TIGR03437 family)
MKRIFAFLALSASAVFAQTPVTTEVLNNYGLINAGTVAQGAIFIVKGSNLSDQTTTLQSAPLQTTLVGVRMEITVGSTTTFAPMYYALPQQLAGILPSNTPVGFGTLIVRNNGRSSAPRGISVVRSAFGLLTLNGSGNGSAAVHDAVTYELLSSTKSTNPGKYLIFYGSGLGPTAGNETLAQTGVNASGDLTGIPISVTIGGKTAQVLYRGRTSFPGLDQINVQVPTLDTYGCDVAVIIRTNNVAANAATIPVAQTGTTCPPPVNSGGGTIPIPGLTQSQIDGILARGIFRTGSVSVGRGIAHVVDFNGNTPPTTTRATVASGSFYSYSGTDLPLLFGTASLPSGYSLPAPGVCNVFESSTIPAIPTVAPNIVYRSLDAGPSLSVRGPGGTLVLPKESTLGFISYLVQGTSDNLPGGTYTFTGPGGPDVGSFSISADLGPELVWTNRTSVQTVTRANGVTLTWTGGDASQPVYISGTSVVVSLSGTSTAATFICYANQSAGTFSVPASILNRLPASADLGIPGFSYVTPGSLYIGTGAVTYRTEGNLDLLTFSSSSAVSQTTVFK